MSQCGVIFDMDGVLIDSGDAHWIAWSRLGAEIGTPFPRAIFESSFGMHNLQIVPQWLGEDTPEAETARLSARKEAIFRDIAGDSVKPLPGVQDLIRALRADGFSLAVGSSGPRLNVELALRILGVHEHFACLATGDDVRHGKPNPEVFLIATRRLGLPADRCVVIEDAPQGVAAGIAAGNKVVALTTTKPRSALGAAQLIVDSHLELSPRRLRAVAAGEPDGGTAPARAG